MAKYNIVISGYYGFHNAGDEAMLLAILQALRKTFNAPSITVISEILRIRQEHSE